MKATLYGKEIDCLVDTGATISVIHPSYFQAVRDKADIKIEPYNGSLRMADGGLVASLGQAVLSLLFSKSQYIKHRFVIAEIEAPMVLGLDFLQQHRGVVDAHKNELSLNGVAHRCHNEVHGTFVYHIVLKESVTIQPGIEMMLPGHFDSQPNFAIGLVEPCEKFVARNEVLVAKSVVNSTVEDVPVRVMNLSEKECILYAGTHLATFEAVVDVSDPEEEEVVGHLNVMTEEDGLPEHLQTLFQDCLSYVKTDQEKAALEKLLKKYSNTFAKSKADLGRTNVVKHSINTGDANPVKQRPRRVPMALRDEAEAEVERMLNQGVIQPSNNPWVSPVVLVQKKDQSIRYCIDPSTE